MDLSEKTIERLLLYRVILMELKSLNRTNIHSYELAELANNSATQVRRDIMGTGYTGAPAIGYEIAELVNKIKEKLNLDSQIRVALVGIGNLGSAILSFFKEHKTRFKVAAAFDVEPQKINTTIFGSKTYSVKRIAEIIERENITLGVIATPDSKAQEGANMLVGAGIRGILNFTSIPLKVPQEVKLNRIDITLQFEKLAFYSQ